MSPSDDLPLQAAIQSLNMMRSEALLGSGTPVAKQTLVDAMEEMFRNITISLPSSHALQPNTSSEFAPSKTNVSTTTFGPVYSYSAGQLWLAYGLAMLATIAAALCSSIYRVGRGAALGVPMRPEDADGADPLPDAAGYDDLLIDVDHPRGSETPSVDSLETLDVTLATDSLPAQEVSPISNGSLYTYCIRVMPFPRS
ncbi:hypothetical protein GGR56DRAFT_668829 [Xylariaceae sp. FL0804]|nr:hypothetical protein GGR56DRAFT_668829 [Xylariaceae sp. FL0804]